MHDDGVDGIFYFVRNAGSEASNGGKPPRKFDLVFNAAYRLRIPHRQQGSDSFTTLRDEIERDLDTATVFQLDFALRNALMQSKRIEHNAAQLVGVGKHAFDGAPQDLATRTPDKSLRGGA